MTDQPSQVELETLFVNNPDLDRISGYLNRFNPIRVMKMESMEVRHSNILAWLMDPSETHGFGDQFLRAFLSEALKGDDDNAVPSALDVSLSDLHDVEIRREWQNIDIFVLAPRQGWAFLIENKYHSSQHGNQLARYREMVQSAFESRDHPLAIRGIFLTLNDEDPEDDSYRIIRYERLSELLATLMQRQGQTIGADVSAFLSNYLETINEATGMSEDLASAQKLARSLYRSHRRVLDFIQEHGATTDFSLALSEIFGDEWEDREVVGDGSHDYRNIWYNGKYLTFIPEEWYQALGGGGDPWPGCERYASGLPVSCWLELRSSAEGSGGMLYLRAEVGPLTDPDARKSLIESIKDAAENNTALRGVGFTKAALIEGAQYSRFFKHRQVHIRDVQDSQEIYQEVVKLFEKCRAVFDGLTPVLTEFKKQHGGKRE